MASVPAWQMKSWEEAFTLFSRNSTYIAKENLWLLMRSVGEIPAKKELDDLLTLIQGNNMSQKQWIDLMVGRQEDSAEKEFEEVFKKVDKDGNGTIDAGELKDVMQNLGETQLTDEEIKAMVAAADVNGDGTIDFAEFKGIVMC